jgi:hypothetical protein
MQDDDTDALLALAARQRPKPSPGLMARVLADALALQTAARPVRQGLWARLADAFGGAPVLAGLGSSVALGLAIGYVNPTTADYLTGGLSGLSGTETLDLFPGTDALLTEG